MRKIRLLFCALLLSALFLSSSEMYATKVYSVDESFGSAPASNWGFGAITGHTFGYDAVNKRFTIRWSSASSYSTKTLPSNVAPGTDNKITIETIVKFYTSGNSSCNGNLYFLDGSGNAITGIAFGRYSSNWRIARATSYPGAIAPTAVASTANPLGTSTSGDGPLVKITLVMDFSVHTLDYTATFGTFDNTTRVFTASTPTLTATGQSFINASASNIGSFISNFFKTSTLSGTCGYDMMYFGLSSEQTVSSANVTVKYKDQNGTYFKSDEIIANQVVGNPYNATVLQKANYSDGTNNYVLDPASPISVAAVDAAGSTLELLFRKAPYFSSMTWNGTADVNGNLWSEWYQNFINSATATASQSGSNLTFDGTAANKAVVVSDAIGMGAGNITISSPDYVFSGAGAISGTGALNINIGSSDALTLGVTNNLSGATTIQGGNITLSKGGVLGLSTITTSGVTTFTTNAAQTIPSITFGAASTINGSTYNNVLTGISTSSPVKIAISSGYNTPAGGTPAVDFGVGGTLTSGSEFEFTGSGTDNKFGIYNTSSINVSYFSNAKVTLKGNALLFYDGTPSATDAVVNIGTLSGESTSKIGWSKSSDLTRNLIWSVGANNENSVFAGTITNTGGYKGSGSMYVGNYTNLTKVGTGTLTLSGTSTGYNGNLTVTNGELAITGTVVGNNQATTPLANTVSVSGTSSKLSVSGTGSLTATTVTVGAGSKLDVGTGSTLTAATLNLNSDATNGTATFVNNGTATVTTANVQQYLTSGRNWYVSSPVSAAPYTQLSTATKVFKYDEPSAQFVEVTTGTLSPLVGYISQTTTASSAITLSGTLNDGVQTVTLPRTYGVTKSGFNLVGNPYASYVSWDAAEKTNLEPTMWYRSMNAGATSYVFDTYNATSSIGTSNNGEVVNTNIPPMQAFWVRVKPAVLANDTTGTLTFRNSMRSHKGASDLKLKSRAVADATQQVLRLQVSNGTNSDEAVVYFNPNASDGLDDYDSPKMSNANAAIPEIYTIAGTEKLVINGLSVVTPEETLPLGFTTGQSNSFSIKATQIANFDGMKVYLRDNVLNTEQELTNASSYTFTSDVASTTTRFSVVFKAAGVTTGINASTDQAVVINKNANNQITINCKGAINSDSFVSVYNALGQKVSAQQITASNTIISSSFRPGVYVVTVNNGNKTTTKKVILN